MTGYVLPYTIVLLAYAPAHPSLLLGERRQSKDRAAIILTNCRYRICCYNTILFILAHCSIHCLPSTAGPYTYELSPLRSLQVRIWLFACGWNAKHIICRLV